METPLPPQPSETLDALLSIAPAEIQELLRDLVASLAPRFQGIRPLGQGGMGLVFRARDPLLKRDVAIKVLATRYLDDATARERFIREAQAAAMVAHPYVVSIFQVGELRETRLPYFVMQYIEGRTIGDAFPYGSRPPVDRVRRLTAQMASALAAAHARGLVHRDIKPANVMVDDSTNCAVVLDFGISASVHPDQQSGLTVRGAPVGTPRYMSPEQARGLEVGPETDVYGLGCVVFEMLAGRPVFEANSALGVMAAHLADSPVDIGTLRPEVDPELRAIVMRCLAKSPSERPTAQEISRRLSRDGEAFLEWPPPGTTALQGRMTRVLRPLWLGNALVFGSVFLLSRAGAGGNGASPTLDAITTLLVMTGVACVLLATLQMVNLILQIRKLGANAYPSGLLTDLLLDVQEDHGALLAGSGRWAALSVRDRNRLLDRRAALRRSSVVLGALLIPLCLVMIGPLGGQAGNVGAAVLIALAGLIGLATILNRINESLIAPKLPGTAKNRLAVDVATAEGWLRDTESLTAEPRGTMTVAPRTLALSTLVASMSAVLVLIFMIPMFIIIGFGRDLPQMVPEVLLFRLRAVESYRPLLLPADSSIRPPAAGLALYRLQAAGPTTPWDAMHPARDSFPWEGGEIASATFGANGRARWVGPDPGTIFAFSRTRMSAQQREDWTRIVQSSSHADLQTVATAPQIDYWSARLIPALPSDVSLLDLPIPRIEDLREVTLASLVRAADHAAAGRRDSAEWTLRLTLSAGTRIMDNAATPIELLTGSMMASIGRDGFEQYVKHFRQTATPRLVATIDSLKAQARTRNEVFNDPLFDIRQRSLPTIDWRTRLVTESRNPRLPRVMRSSYLALLGLTPCSNLKELMFGISRESAMAFDDAAKMFAVIPSDSVVLRLNREAALHAYSQVSEQASLRLFDPAARLASVVLGNPRILACYRNLPALVL